MRIFITGEQGFIGRNLVKKLTDFGYEHVSSYDAESIAEKSPNRLVF